MAMATEKTAQMASQALRALFRRALRQPGSVLSRMDIYLAYRQVRIEV